MKFIQILPDLLRGVKIKRVDWKHTQYIYLNDENIIKDGNRYTYGLYGHDLIAEWEYQDEEKELEELSKIPLLTFNFDKDNVPVFYGRNRKGGLNDK